MRSTNSISFWNKAWTNEDDRFYNHFLDILDLLLDKGKVIDIGCGTGSLLALIKKEKPRIVLEGQDHSDIAIKKLKKRGINGRVVTLPKIEGIADIIIATEVLEHMKDDLKLLKKMSQHSKKIIITVPNNRLGPDECKEHERKYTDLSLAFKLDKYFKHFKIFDAGNYLLAIAEN